MAKYTIELRSICESEAGLLESRGYNDIEAIVSAAWPKIFSFDFPVFDEAYRPVLCKHILKHFYTREICEETYGLWKLRLENAMHDYMPIANQLYSATLEKIDPFTTDETRTQNTGTETSKTNGTTSGTNTSTGTAERESLDLYSDTPQGTISNIKDTNAYLSNARKVSENSKNADKSEISSVNVGETKNVNDYITIVSGRSGKAKIELLNDFKNGLFNVDELVIDHLQPLFFSLW